jgi:hypothetical protein
LQVLSRYKAWDSAREAKNMLRSERELIEGGINTSGLRQRAKSCTRLRRYFDAELKKAADKHGTLGAGGTEIDKLMGAMKDLELYVTCEDRELRDQLYPLRPSGLGTVNDHEAVKRGIDACRSCTTKPSSVTAPDLFSALVAYAMYGGVHFGVCSECRTLLIGSGKTCSPRCRRRRSPPKHNRRTHA